MLKISIENGAFKDSFGREVVLRGINFAADAKLPAKPFMPSHAPEDDLFFDGDNVSFVGSPCSLEELDLHLKRLKSWGFNTIRYIFTWEALEHDGPGIYDEEFIDFTIKVLYRLKHYQFYVIMDPHQDCWSRFCGGSGAPLWTHYAAGLNPRNFKTTQAALLESHFLDKPKEKPKMVWASNYTRLAASTLFTLFFAGKIFAPKCVINGLNIQDFLESHFINAVTRLAERVHSDTTEPGGLEKCIIGWESINEPGHGYIGIEDLTEVPKSQQVKLYTVPTGANGMALGYGYEQTMPKFEFGLMGPKVVNSKVSVDPKGVKAWLSPEETEHFDKHYGWKRAESWVAGECIWHLHGVWKDSKRGFTLLRPDYFCYDLEGKHMDHSRFVDETFTNHWLAYVKSLKKVIPDDSFLFYQPPVLASPPDLKSRGLVEKNMVYSPHYYDGLTLMLKHWNKNFNVDAVGVIRGKYANPPVMAVRLGENNIRRCLGDQLATLKKEGVDAFGADVPCLITEIGVPYDMDDKQAYNTGDFSSQIRSMDANNHALEFARLSHTLWVYVTRNTNKFGDNWNGEDLSIWSTDAVRSNESNGTAVLVQKIKTRSSSLGLSKSKTPEFIHSAENIDDLTLAPISENCASANQADYSNFHHPKNFLEGARAPEAFIRPVPVGVSGKILLYQFNMRKAKFTLKLESFGRKVSDQSLNHLAGMVPTVIYLPTYHFPVERTGVSTSAGIWKIDRVNQLLFWWHLEGPQKITVTGQPRRSLEEENTSTSSESFQGSQCRIA